MGIKNLFYSLPNLSVEKSLSEFAHKRIGIDANVWMFKAYHSQFNSDATQNITGLIRIFDQRIKMFIKNKIDVA